MNLWSSSDLLARCKRLLNRPTVDAGMGDEEWYAFMTEGQAKWYEIMASRVPFVLYAAPELLTTSDDGATYAFSSTPFPGGHIEIRTSRSGAVASIGEDWDAGADFTWEGDKLRVPDGKTRTFSAGPYARYIAAPTVIDADTEPTLKPPSARRLIVYDACAMAAVRLGTHDPATFRDLEQRTAWGDPRVPGDVGLIGALRTQVFQGAYSGAWWRNISPGYTTS